MYKTTLGTKQMGQIWIDRPLSTSCAVYGLAHVYWAVDRRRATNHRWISIRKCHSR